MQAEGIQELVATTRLPPEETAARQRAIYNQLLDTAAYLDEANFTVIHPDDLERLFDLYDSTYFHGGCRQLLGNAPLRFRLSKRMTSAGGKTTRRRYRDRRLGEQPKDYEIAISTTLFFQTFQEDHRPIVVSGIHCTDRLEALQRVMEHELTHLLEMLIWIDSSCSRPRFQSIANRLFGHTDHRHQLITPAERAWTKFGVKPGDQVSFRMDGRHYVGLVNRITRRATVLVEDPQGQRYTNGKRYRKFYIPVGMLEPVGR